MTEWFRVKDKETKHEYSTVAPRDGEEVLKDKPAVDAYGRPLPAKHHTTVKAPSQAATSKEN